MSDKRKKVDHLWVDVEFKRQLKQGSEETGLSLVDLTRLAARRGLGSNMLLAEVVKKKGKKKAFKLKVQDPILEMFDT